MACRLVGSLRKGLAASSPQACLAACLIGCESGEMIVGRPARELAPFDRLEMAAREFQRFFGQCAGGRETDNRATQACGDDAARPLRKLPTSLHANKCTADRNGSTTRATISLAAVEWLCRAGARYRDAGKKQKSFECNFSARRALTIFRHGPSRYRRLLPYPLRCANVS